MFARILVAYDGSEHARKALEVAVDLASKYGAKLFVVEVVDSKSLTSSLREVPSLDVGRVIAEIKSKASVDVRECLRLAQSRGVDAEGDVLEGDPASEILRYAEEVKADLIVTGSRGLSLWKRIFIGSVSSKIVSESKVPVLVVK
ncbi:universal stress protein [Thermofilum pendens]|uniref:UspA domain protein n=1 Tax=Thermofilum pendens (strain DSM 2475 / Hrk 5) TaxID=368408 RepID=A1S083_THEPD|nr:universal stress protein [Thermofilum pendens]ABL78863.1 UspA domain protein [Thermofilum pendens Hrk 5]